MFSKRFLYALPLMPALVQADDIPPMPPASPSLHVGDMLAIDARRALAAEQARQWPMLHALAPVAGVGTVAGSHPGTTLRSAGVVHHPPQAADADSDADAASIALLAIYGVDKRLYADVRIDGRLVTYTAGRAAPIRTGVADMAWSLKAIRSPCITLSDKAGQQRESCIGES